MMCEGFPVEFMLNNELVSLEVADIDRDTNAEPAPDTTILKMLRERGLVGTKEGCASGDCGACTVMIGEANPAGKIEYRSVNACISLAGSLANKHLVTVEGLAKNPEPNQPVLHPVQSEMVECHGSQCGFCTPGFVMSLATLSEQTVNGDEQPEIEEARTRVLDAISGNLCRCTGYRPIIEAGINVLTNRKLESIAQNASNSFLREASGVPAGTTVKGDAGYHLPRSLTELDDLVARFGNGVIVAGCTDFSLEITQRWQEFRTLVDITQVSELLSLRESGDELALGAAVTYTDIEGFFKDRSPAFVHLLHRLGSRQIRNRGTIGGNIGNASPIADTPPVLLAWDADLVIRSCSSGAVTEESEVPIAAFYLDYRKTLLQKHQYIAGIKISAQAINRFHRFYKHSKRLEDDISSVMGAFSFDGDQQQLTHARVAYGGMAAVPLRVPVVETLLLENQLTEDLINQACSLLIQTLTPMTDVRASAEFRAEMASEMLSRSLLEYLGKPLPRVDELEISGNGGTENV